MWIFAVDTIILFTVVPFAFGWGQRSWEDSRCLVVVTVYHINQFVTNTFNLNSVICVALEKSPVSSFEWEK